MIRPFETETSMRRMGIALALLLAALALVLAAVGALVRIWGVDGTLGMRGDSAAPSPGLETAPQPALHAYEAEKRRLTQSYARLDEEAHLIRIPVDEAMRALAAPAGGSAAGRAAYLMGLAENEP